MQVTVVGARRRRRVAWLLALAVLLLVACLASIALGARPVPLGAVWQALISPDDSENHIVIRSLRLPRTLLGLMVGMSLGVAGALIQGHTRNPLADPGLLGVTQGAALAVVFGVVVLGVDTLYGFVWFAFAGALIAAVVVFLLASTGGRGASPVTLALAGAAITALLHGIVAAIVLGDRSGMEVYRFWQVGSIAARDYAVAGQIAPFLLAGLLLAVINTPGLNALALGEDVAAALGQRIRLARTLGIATITLLTGAAVAACGPIAFVGLAVPHIARAITGPDYRWVVPFSALLGAAMVLLADVLGRLISSDSFEVGVLLAVLGAPVFVALVRAKGLVRL